VLIKEDNINTAWAPLVFALMGVGGVLVPNQVIITVITPDDLIGSVTALTVSLRSQAQVIGLAIFYNQLVAKITSGTYKYVVPAFFDIKFINGQTVTTITDMMHLLTAEPYRVFAEGFPELQTQQAYDVVLPAVRRTYIEAFQFVWYITIAFGVFACIAAACMGNVTKYLDNHVAVVLDAANADKASKAQGSDEEKFDGKI
jgi:hypothetical protein